MQQSYSLEYCVARAEKCEELASQSAFDLTRQKFLELAAQWRVLADEAKFSLLGKRYGQ